MTIIRTRGRKTKQQAEKKMSENSELDATFELTEEQAFQLWKKDIEADGQTIVLGWAEEENEEEN